MKTFIIWLEAVMNKEAVPFDQDDIAYLKQVNREFWKDALKKRYNDFLMKAAVDLQAERPIQDTQSTTLQGLGKRKLPIELNTGMTKLINKLQGLGFDLSDPQPASSTLGSMHLMSSMTAGKLLRNWLAQNPDGELLPGFKQYTPNKLQSKVNSMDDVYAAESKFARIKPKVEQVARRIIDRKLATLADPNHPYHINYYYWVERKDELLQAMLEAVKDNLNAPSEEYYRVMMNKIANLLQTGHVGKRVLDTARQNNVDINALLKKGHTIQQITDSLYAGRQHNRYSKPQFDIGAPQSSAQSQQQDFKNIAQSVPSQSAAINKYGDRNLFNKRRKATSRILQGLDTTSDIGTYALAPTESFKNWLMERDEIFSEWLKHKSIINIAKHAKLDISKYSAKELEMGMKEELEHGKKNKEFNITKDDPVKTLKIVLAHLKEDPKYYTKLKRVL